MIIDVSFSLKSSSCMCVSFLAFKRLALPISLLFAFPKRDALSSP